MNRILFGTHFLRTLTTAANAIETPPPAIHRHKTLLITGLGNTAMPNTRHNVGFAAIDAFHSSISQTHLESKWTMSRNVQGQVALARFTSKDLVARKKGAAAGEVTDDWTARVVLLKPKGFMNLSGVSVAKGAREYSIKPADTLVLHDELEKKLGSMGLKLSGSHGGHNGLRSIQTTFHTDAFGRLRIGIGRPASKDKEVVARYVLERFHLDEEEMLEEEVYPAVEKLIRDWIVVRMNAK
ncbi:peptidyl-tRNA hydrolase protein 1 [Chytriomyces hyalinus]|nr:peptidyl-tRNA hydrolase protein 1 [Chytriomyces hyalinus]